MTDWVPIDVWVVQAYYPMVICIEYQDTISLSFKRETKEFSNIGEGHAEVQAIAEILQPEIERIGYNENIDMIYIQ